MCQTVRHAVQIVNDLQFADDAADIMTGRTG
jgi:hypothetical protein